MSLFNLNLQELYTFFAVLVRYSVLFSILPLVGDRMVPGPVKILLALVCSFTLFPALVKSGFIHPRDALVWAATPIGIIGTILLEIIFALILGFTTKILFDGIAFGANLVGNFMGFASATIFDPHQESQTEIIGHFQTTLAMLIFLSMDGHHLMLKASLESYKLVGIGKAVFSAGLTLHLTRLTAEVLRFGFQIAAPIALSLFAVNVVFGVVSKSMPQLNIFVLTFPVSAFVGLVVMLLALPEFHDEVAQILGRMYDWMNTVSLALAGGK